MRARNDYDGLLNVTTIAAAKTPLVKKRLDENVYFYLVPLQQQLLWSSAELMWFQRYIQRGEKRLGSI